MATRLCTDKHEFLLQLWNLVYEKQWSANNFIHKIAQMETSRCEHTKITFGDEIYRSMKHCTVYIEWLIFFHINYCIVNVRLNFVVFLIVTLMYDVIVKFSFLANNTKSTQKTRQNFLWHLSLSCSSALTINQGGC